MKRPCHPLSTQRPENYFRSFVRLILFGPLLVCLLHIDLEAVPVISPPVFTPPPGPVPILKAPLSQTVQEGDPVRFEVVPVSPHGALAYQWFKDGTAISGATNALLNVAGIGAPLARWPFDTDAQDVLGGLGGTLVGGATVSQGRLQLNGNGQYLRSSPLAADIREKTLEAWVYITSVDGIHRDVISLQTLAGSYLTNEFDAILLGEGEPGHWRAGSDYFRRTQSFGGPAEIANSSQWVHVAAVYSADHRIAFYRNGSPYGEGYVPHSDRSTLRPFSAGTSVLTLGTRNLDTPQLSGAFQGQMNSPERDESATNKKRRKRTLRFTLPRGCYATVVLRALGQ